MNDRTKDLVAFGYAPGNYMFRCIDCSGESLGDKRAMRCKECAEQAMNNSKQSEVVSSKHIVSTHREFDRVLRNQYLLAVALRNIAAMPWDARKDDRQGALDACMTLVRETEEFATESQGLLGSSDEARSAASKPRVYRCCLLMPNGDSHFDNWVREDDIPASETSADIGMDLGMQTPWPLRDVLAKLVQATDHLLTVHSCDTHGHEEFRRAVIRGREYLSEPRKPCGAQVEGDTLPTPLWQFEQRASALLSDEQAKVSPDNALIGFICDAVRLARENERLSRSPLEPIEKHGIGLRDDGSNGKCGTNPLPEKASCVCGNPNAPGIAHRNKGP